MDSSRGIWKLGQLNEHVPVSCNPTFEYFPNRHASPMKGSKDPNFPMQLSTCSPKPFLSLIPPKLGTIQACGSSANPTSTRSASSQYVSQWRSVARWETNGADLLPSDRHEMEERLRESSRQAYEIARILGCLDEATLAMSPIPLKPANEPQVTPTESIRPPTVCARVKEQEYGQISPPEINVESSRDAIRPHFHT